MASKWGILVIVRIEFRPFIAFVFRIGKWWKWPVHVFTCKEIGM
jgi:hypothetical protein